MEFGILGPLQIRIGAAVQVVPAAKQRVLLAALLVRRGQVVPADQLADAVWGAHPPPSAATTLRNYVMRLRRGLGEAGERIETHAGGYVVRVAPGEFDADRFTALRALGADALRDGAPDRAVGLFEEALALWRGPALVDVDSDTLRLAEAGRLAEARLDVRESKLDAELRLGRHSGLLGELRALTASHPERERFWVLLMTALYRSGRQSEALTAYQEVHRILGEEIGVEPGAELRTVHRRILRADPALDGPSEGPPRPGLPTAPAGQGHADGRRRRPGGQPGPVDGRRTRATSQSGHATSQSGHATPQSGRAASQSGLADVRPGHAIVSPEQVRPFQLPPDVPDFTGRNAVRADLTARLAARGRRAPFVAAVSGGPGSGKTALAVHLAHSVRAQHPEGTLFASLRGSTPAPAAPAAVLHGFLTALGVPGESVPAGVEARTALFRSLIAGRRMLVVLDDARDTAQVRPLLPSDPGHAVLVTGRGRFTDLVGAQPVVVGGLGEAAARVFLARAAGTGRACTDPDAAAALVRACDGLPLALRICAARLSARPSWSVRDLAALLADDRRLLDALRAGDLDVRAALSGAYDALAPTAARALRLLAPADGLPTVRVPAAARVLGECEPRTEHLLEQLVDAHLLTAVGRGEYRYPRLVRVFARECGGRVDGVLAQRRAEQAAQQGAPTAALAC
ncbi:BTAD domain-containing putative transcriptional regulator [Kitasatospora sp. NBC_01539]|uniref:AfsR/SARP family transcriptional regulator n=1 Tax=Kitasatospora sp. NBC_01539 TaxID=2903577 RepID=UPI0038601718